MAATQHPGVVVRIPPPVWLLISALIAYAIHRSFDTPFVLRSVPAAIVLAIAGIVLAMWGGATFSRAGTELNPASQSNAKLVTNGPFRYTRNPMYSGVVLVSLAIDLFFGTLPFFIATLLLFLLINGTFIPFEEAKMERQYGAEFRAYKSGVRRWGVL
jgi:protein-S-isoprenylcysteine O-methyltransferase Ste14